MHWASVHQLVLRTEKYTHCVDFGVDVRNRSRWEHEIGCSVPSYCEVSSSEPDVYTYITVQEWSIKSCTGIHTVLVFSDYGFQVPDCLFFRTISSLFVVRRFFYDAV